MGRDVITRVKLSKDDVRQLAHSFIWIYTQPLFKLNNPVFSKSEAHDLKEFVKKASKIEQPNFVIESIEITSCDVFLNSHSILHKNENISNLIYCLNLFYNEFKDDSEEIEALTNSSLSNLLCLVSKLMLLNTQPY